MPLVTGGQARRFRSIGARKRKSNEHQREDDKAKWNDRLGNEPPMERNHPSLYLGRRGASARLHADRMHPGAPRRRDSLADAAHGVFRSSARRADRKSGSPAG